MRHRLTSLVIKVGLPVLVGQFLFDLASSGLAAAVAHLPLRAALILAVLLLWGAARESYKRHKRSIR